MNRIQTIVAVGLFLIVGLFGWRTYLEKSSHKNRNDERGLPAEFLKEVELHKAKQSKLSNGAKAKAQAKQTEGSKGDADPIPQAAPQ